jgi:hypothetical protein
MKVTFYRLRQVAVRLGQGLQQGRQSCGLFLQTLPQKTRDLRHTYFSDGRRVKPIVLAHMRQDLLGESDLGWDYLTLVLGSCIIATFGLLSNSAAVIIGAMLIAPLMLPIRGVAFGILEADRELIRTRVDRIACLSSGL